MNFPPLVLFSGPYAFFIGEILWTISADGRYDWSTFVIGSGIQWHLVPEHANMNWGRK